MANHKKKRHPNRRSHCSLCKPWKDGRVSRTGKAFEKWSDHKKRISITEE